MIDMTYDPRAAMEIRRYHTWRVSNQQSVGEHTAQVLRILLTVWPSCPRRVLVHAVIHDVGEVSGDVPYPFKTLFPELRVGADKAEAYVRGRMEKEGVGLPKSHPLSPYEYAAFKACENVEMWEFGLTEVSKGNKYGELIVERMSATIPPLLHQMETELATSQDAQHHPGVPAAIHRYQLARLEQENYVYG